MAKSQEIKVFQLKIQLRETGVWRRFQVISDILLPELHLIIQTIMGWTNSHLHHFIVKNVFYAEPSEDDFDDNSVDYERISLEDVVGKKDDRLVYEYDFGDSWLHDITVEDILPLDEDKYYPVCLEGKNACPPEDCGSTPGYAEILNALKNRKNPKYEELLEWVGDDYHPEFFDLDVVNEMLKEEDYGCIALYDD